MIRKVYEVSPLLCPRCGGTMKVIAFITDYPVVDRIINHLKLSFAATNRSFRWLMKSLRDELLPEKKREDLPGEHPGEEAIRKTGDMMEAALAILAHQTAEASVKTDLSRLEFGEKL